MATRTSVSQQAFLVRLRKMEEEQRVLEGEDQDVDGKIARVEAEIQQAKEQEAKKESAWWEMQANMANAERMLKMIVQEKLDLEGRIRDVEKRMEYQCEERNRIERKRKECMETTQQEHRVLQEFNQMMEPVIKAIESTTSEAKNQADELKEKHADPIELKKIRQLNERLGNLLCQHEQLANESQALDKRHEQLQQDVANAKEKIRAQADAHQVILQHLNAEEQAARRKLLHVLDEEQRAQEELSHLITACDALEARYQEISPSYPRTCVNDARSNRQG